MKKYILGLALVATTVFANVANAGLPKGFYVSETNHQDHIVFTKTKNGNVVVQMDGIDITGSSFNAIVKEVAYANGEVSCTKMKDSTPLGGPRFHCTDNSSRVPFTLHLAPSSDGQFVMQVTIAGDGYPGFGITYDDVLELVDYWVNVD